MGAVRRFSDSENGGFYLSESDNTELFMNPKEIYDGTIPSGNSVMAYNFVRMYQLTDKAEYVRIMLVCFRQMNGISNTFV